MSSLRKVALASRTMTLNPTTPYFSVIWSPSSLLRHVLRFLRIFSSSTFYFDATVQSCRNWGEQLSRIWRSSSPGCCSFSRVASRYRPDSSPPMECPSGNRLHYTRHSFGALSLRWQHGLLQQFRQGKFRVLIVLRLVIMPSINLVRYWSRSGQKTNLPSVLYWARSYSFGPHVHHRFGNHGTRSRAPTQKKAWCHYTEWLERKEVLGSSRISESPRYIQRKN